MKTIQYALVYKDENNDPVCLTHQDDLETPIVASTLNDLLYMFGDWADQDITSALREMEPPEGEFANLQIIRQEVTDVPLTEEDLELLKQEMED